MVKAAWIRPIFGRTVIAFFGAQNPLKPILMAGFSAVVPGVVKAIGGNVYVRICLIRPFVGHIPLGIEDHLTVIGIEMDAIAIILMAGFIATAYSR